MFSFTLEISCFHSIAFSALLNSVPGITKNVLKRPKCCLGSLLSTQIKGVCMATRHRFAVPDGISSCVGRPQWRLRHRDVCQRGVSDLLSVFIFLVLFVRARTASGLPSRCQSHCTLQFVSALIKLSQLKVNIGPTLSAAVNKHDTDEAKDNIKRVKKIKASLLIGFATRKASHTYVFHGSTIKEEIYMVGSSPAFCTHSYCADLFSSLIFSPVSEVQRYVWRSGEWMGI